MPADIRQFGTGGVGDFLLGQNGMVDLFFQVFIGRQFQKIVIQNGGHGVGFGVVFHLSCTAQDAGNLQQLSCGKTAAPVRPGQGGADVLDAAQPGRALLHHQLTGSGGLCLQLTDIVHIRQGRQLQASRLGFLAAGLIGQQLQHGVQLQLLKRFFI